MEALIVAVLAFSIDSYFQPILSSAILIGLLLIVVSVAIPMVLGIFSYYFQQESKPTEFQKKIFHNIKEDLYLKELEAENTVLFLVFILASLFINIPGMFIYFGLIGLCIALEYMSYFSLTYYDDLQRIMDASL